MKFLMIQGTSSGAGKTTLVTALCRIFTKRGYLVAPFKSQNMSNYSYKGKDFEISRAQAIQAIGADCEITSDLNPILLKPLGGDQIGVYLQGRKFKDMSATEYYHKFIMNKGLDTVLDSLSRLRKRYDLLIIEGAGSPAEINLQDFDIANMKIAEEVQSPVLLVSDIDRGGSFASIVGTLSLLKKRHRELVRGFVFNKFRGNIDILKPGFKKLEDKTGKPVMGTIPMMEIAIPDEDSLEGKAKHVIWNKANRDKINNEIDKLASTISRNLDINAVEKLLR